jgi:uncharacterized protein
LKHFKKHTKLFFPIVITIFYFSNSFAQTDTTRSLAFKKKVSIRPPIFYYPDYTYQLWQIFSLTREANDNDPFAEHELGIRYLLGDGVPADTVKAAYWIKKAADQNLTVAQYNYGIMLFNGWGTKWNPFMAFEYIQKAAKGLMPQAEYIYGLMFTDNLIVPRDWKKTYKWIKIAAENNYVPAEKTLKELKAKIPASLLDTSGVAETNSSSNHQDESQNIDHNDLASSLGLVYIDFSMAYDTSSKISDKTLQSDLLLSGNDKLKDTVRVNNELTVKVDSSNIPAIMQASNFGSPEALAFLARMYEKGIYFPQNLMTAAEYYLRAIRLNSPRAPYFLEDLEKNQDFINQLKEKIDRKDAKAMFVLYGLFSFGYTNDIFKQDAIKLLEESADRNFLPAIDELGLLYSTGEKVKKNVNKANELWKKAEQMGDQEAKIRIALSEIFSNDSENISSNIDFLRNCEKLGSILAQTGLGYCYENGVGVNKDKSTAVQYYRMAAQRGSLFAYTELKKMYDQIRPNDPIFQLN